MSLETPEVAPLDDPPSSLRRAGAPPSLAGSWVQLRPVVPSDYPFLYELTANPQYGFAWRGRAGQPTYDDFVRTLGVGVFQQFLVTTVDGRRRLGLVLCYQADFRNRHAYLAMQAVPEVTSRGWVLQAGGLFVNYLFSCFDFEKLYAESPEFVVDSFRSGLGKDFVQEACFTRHERYMGRWWDSYVFAYYRSRWEEVVAEGGRRLGLESPGARRAEEPLSFESFTGHLEEHLELDPGSLTAETAFAEDLGFDSIRMLELLSVIEDLGVLLDDQALAEITTVDEAFFAYIQRTGS